MLHFLLRAHSGWRWVVLITLLVALIIALINMRDKSKFASRKSALFGLIATHIQLLIGIILYFMSPKVKFGDEMMSNDIVRFFTVEHVLMALIGVVLITMGYGKAKRTENSDKTIFWFYLFGLLFILSRIPWPSMGLGANWF